MQRLLAPYKPLQWQIAPFKDKSKVMLLTGGAGGGKSRIAGEKINAYLWKYAGATGLIVRKAREFVTKSAVPFMWQTVMGHDPRIIHNSSASMFKYPNGSVLYYGGMLDDKQRESIRSIGGTGGVDIIWMEEANAFTEHDYEELLGRLRGTASSWRQIILSTNPDAPNHWINKRLILDRQASVYYSRNDDNPNNPSDYQQTLELMTGVQYQRMVLGQWVQAEGIVFDSFSIEHNVSESAEYDPANGGVIWGVDDGYALGGGVGSMSYHPRVVLFAQFTAQGGVNVFAEYNATQEVSETTLSNALAYPYPVPDIAYIDSSASELKMRIWQLGIQTYGATHKVSEGIKNVRRLICDGQGVRLLKVHPRCKNLISEFQSYQYSSNGVVENGEPKPLKMNDHNLDALRYLTYVLRYSGGVYGD